MTYQEQRVIIKFLYDDGLKVEEIEQKLINHFGDDAYKMLTIKNGLLSFNAGKKIMKMSPGQENQMMIKLNAIFNK